jgi:hypothetical protein
VKSNQGGWIKLLLYKIAAYQDKIVIQFEELLTYQPKHQLNLPSLKPELKRLKTEHE